MKFAVCVLSLGYTRLAGITLYDSKSRDFTETTPRVARELIKQGLVKGVKWKDGGFVPDPDFNMNDILVKSGVGKYRPLIHDIPGVNVNSTYMLVRVLETNKGNLYEIISNKCQRVKITEKQLRGLCEIGPVGGVFVTEDEIKVCDGVVIENRVYPDSVVINPEGIEPVSKSSEGDLVGTEETCEDVEPVEEVQEESAAETLVEEESTVSENFNEISEIDEPEETVEEPQKMEEEPQTMEDVFKGLEPIPEEPEENSGKNSKGKGAKKNKSTKRT